ncbi:IS3 family transposase [Gemella parahaemolysans]
MLYRVNELKEAIIYYIRDYNEARMKLNLDRLSSINYKKYKEQIKKDLHSFYSFKFLLC